MKRPSQSPLHNPNSDARVFVRDAWKALKRFMRSAAITTGLAALIIFALAVFFGDEVELNASPNSTSQTQPLTDALADSKREAQEALADDFSSAKGEDGSELSEQKIFNPEPNHYLDSALDYRALKSLCSDQNMINLSVGAFKEALADVMLKNDPTISMQSLEQQFAGAWRLGADLKKSHFRFMRIRNVGLSEDSSTQITIRCKANLRVLEPVGGSEGAFSSYVQFNDALYTIRIQNYDTPEAKAYILAELRPVGDYWDIETGTE